MKLITIIFLLVYSVSTFVGIGVIRCGCTHSQRLVMMSVQPSCLCSASVETCCSHHEQYDDDAEAEETCGEECCFIAYQYVEADQLNTKHFHNHSTKVLSLLFSPLLPMQGFGAGFKECTFAVNINSPPTEIFKIPIFYLHQQLRL